MLIADRAYDSNVLREQLADDGIQPVIPPRRHVTPRVPPDMQIYKARHLVENAIADLKQFRAIATRYQKRLDTWTALVSLCAVVVNTRPTRRTGSPHLK